jgi:hypothetical protein
MPFTAVALSVLLTLAQAGATPSPGRITGQVVEQGRNAPIANARVNVFLTGRSVGGPPQLFEAVADADGRFAVENIPPGAYRVQATKAGFAAQLKCCRDRRAKA